MLFLQLNNALNNEEFCDRLDSYDFEWCYAALGLTAIPSFSAFLFDAEVNPLENMRIAPPFFVRGLKIDSIDIPNTISTIDAQAFACCRQLKEIIIPSSVTSIEHHAFLSCSSLEAVYIPKEVKNIGEQVFFGCPNLKIYCEAKFEGEDFDVNWRGRETQVMFNATLDDFKRRA